MRRWRFWLTLALSLACAVWWLLHVPYAPARLHACIPAGASFLSIHHDMAGRWDQFSRNPLARSLIGSIGMDPADIDGLSADPEFRTWLRRLASDELLLAHLPAQVPAQEGTWVFASWMGGASQRLRWLLRTGAAGGVDLEGAHSGHAIWRMRESADGPDSGLLFAIVEGGLLGCFSRDVRTITDMLDAYDAQDSGRTRMYTALADRAGSPAAGYPDRGVLSLGREEPAWISYAVRETGDQRLDGRVLLPMKAAGIPDGDESARQARLDVMLGDVPLAMLVASSNAFCEVIRRYGARWWAAPLEASVGALESDTVFLAFVGGPCSDRYLGLKVPGLVLGADIADATRAGEEAAKWIDRLNAKYRWGLIPRDVPDMPWTIRQIESTADSRGVERYLSRRVAYATTEDWLLIGSSLNTLSNLLAAAEQRAEGSPGFIAARLLDSGRSGLGFTWIDLSALRKFVNPLLQMYSHRLLFEDPDGSLRTRQRLNVARAWVDALAPMDSLRVWLVPAEGAVELGFSIGPAKGPQT